MRSYSEAVAPWNVYANENTSNNNDDDNDNDNDNDNNHEEEATGLVALKVSKFLEDAFLDSINVIEVVFSFVIYTH